MPANAPPPYDPPSPCVRSCALDQSNVCTGCRRSLAEIAAWSNLPAATKIAVLLRIARAERAEAALAGAVDG